MGTATGSGGAANGQPVEGQPVEGPPRLVPIDLDEVSTALDDGSWEHTYFLDTETGDVLLVSELWDPDGAQQQLAAIEQAPPGRYRELPRADSRQGYRDLETFIATVADERMQELLGVAIQGRGAFRRFKDVLARSPAEQARWFAFRATRLEARARAWLAEEGLAPAPRPRV